MKTLVLLTSNFPFGTGEPFIGTELPYLKDAFDRVIIIAQNATSPLAKEVSRDTTTFRYNPSTSFTGFLLLPVLIIRNLRLICSACREEIRFRSSIDFRLSLRHRLFLFKKIIKAIQLRDFIHTVVDKEDLTDTVVFYSYWMNSGAHAIALLKIPYCVKISRAHGSDLYEEKSNTGFLPLLKFTSGRLDSVIFPSEHGRNYFIQKTKAVNGHFRVSRLGVNRSFPVNPSQLDNWDPFTIVSCSNLIPLKRVDLIIKSLALINNTGKIHWIHFGDGKLRHDLEKLAGMMLGKKEMLTWEFRGYVPNGEILRFYSNNGADLFLNTSYTEGTPVSIMEAQSYGIPVIATDVGAVREMVYQETGTLLPLDFEPADLSDQIVKYMEKSPAEKLVMRNKIIQNWENNYNAAVNYPDFISQVISIFDSSISRQPE